MGQAMTPLFVFPKRIKGGRRYFDRLRVIEQDMQILLFATNEVLVSKLGVMAIEKRTT